MRSAFHKDESFCIRYRLSKETNSIYLNCADLEPIRSDKQKILVKINDKTVNCQNEMHYFSKRKIFLYGNVAMLLFLKAVSVKSLSSIWNSLKAHLKIKAILKGNVQYGCKFLFTQKFSCMIFGKFYYKIALIFECNVISKIQSNQLNNIL